MTFTPHTVKLPSGEVKYYVGGEGRPVLYWHTGGGVRFSPGLVALAKNFKIYSVVMPGFDGTAPLSGIKDCKDLGKLGGEFMDVVIKDPHCDVVGHSIGGLVAAWTAVLNPGKVGQLVLVGPAGFRSPDVPAAPPPADPKERQRQAYAHPEKMMPDPRSPEVAKKEVEATMGYMTGRAYDTEIIGRLGELECLTMVLVGTQEKAVPPQAVWLLRNAIKRCHSIYLYDAAHMCDIDQPERFAAVVGDFLTRADSFIVNPGNPSAAVGAVA